MFRRVLAAILIVAVAATLLVFAWPQLFGLHRAFGVAHVISFRNASVIIAVLLVGLLTLLGLLIPPGRRFLGSLAVLLVAFALVNGAVLSTRGFGNGSFETPADSDVTVLTWNTLGEAPGAEAVAELALDAGADVVTLPETTEEHAIEIASLMKAGGSPMWVNHDAFDDISKARSTSVLSSVALGEYDVDGTVGSTSTLPSVVIKPVDGTGPVIVAVHAVAPLAVEFGNWRADLDWLAATCTGENTIMAGDFNATLDHMTGLAAAPGATLGQCADAALATGNAAVGTWPTTVPALVGSPIDHVMATPNWRVTGMRVVQNSDTAGSDHRPVIVTYQPAG